ncbi:hypothetical protein FRC02_007057 [Tulasnella sp. 418]|nr:hypothetical protein FRC02_007057 [Tulasnella sp. 418]
MPSNAPSQTLAAIIASQSHLPVTQLFHQGEIVGKGAFGSVHKGTHIATGSVVALKIINLDIADDDVEAIQKEVALLSQLRGGESSNITQYYGCWLDGPRVWIVMDFASGGSVRTLMKAAPNGTLEERYTAIIVREVLVALSFLHRSGVIHRDVKAANILVTAPGRAILCDFGVSALLATTQSKRTTMVGTPYWMAPEVISGSLYDVKADIWSLGITIYEMMMKTPPHADQEPMRAFMLITTGAPPKLPESVGSKEIKDFMAMCLKELATDRLSADELAKSKWIKSVSKIPVTTLRELITRYDSWVKQGGTRDSIIPDGVNDVIMNEELDTVPASWEFDTIRAHHLSDSNASEAIPTPISATPSSSYQAPRSLRMLFEDSSIPPSLPDSFLRNNLGSSRARGVGISPAESNPSSTPLAASAPTPSFLVAPTSGGTIDLDLTVVRPSTTRRQESVDDLQTARQPNFAFPRLTGSRSENVEDDTGDLTVKVPSNAKRTRRQHSPTTSATGNLRRSPSPLASTPPNMSSSVPTSVGYKELRTQKGVTDISAPSTTPSVSSSTFTGSSVGMNVAATTSTDSLPTSHIQSTLATASGMLPSTRGNSDTPPRPGTANSAYASGDDNSPRNAQQRGRRHLGSNASPITFQFPPLATGKVGAASSPPLTQGLSSSRPNTPASKDSSGGGSLKETSVFTGPASFKFGGGGGLSSSFREANLSLESLTPPKPFMGNHHPASRSVDTPYSQRSRDRDPLKVGANAMGTDLVSSPPFLRKNSSSAINSREKLGESDSDATSSHISPSTSGLSGRRLPSRAPVLKRQASAEVGLGVRGLGLRSGGLKDALQLSAPDHTIIASGELLPPSPSTPLTHSISHRTLAQNPTSMDTSTNNGVTPSSSDRLLVGQAATTTMHPTVTTIHSSNLSHSGPIYGPSIRPLDYSALLTSDDVHAELARSVEELSTWLNVVENGLNTVLEKLVKEKDYNSHLLDETEEEKEGLVDSGGFAVSDVNYSGISEQLDGHGIE